jgi:hypothetical protein
MLVLMASVGSSANTRSCSGAKNVFHRHFDGLLLAFEMPIEPAQDGELEFRRFIMTTGRENQAEFVGGFMKLVKRRTLLWMRRVFSKLKRPSRSVPPMSNGRGAASAAICGKSQR